MAASKRLLRARKTATNVGSACPRARKARSILILPEFLILPELLILLEFVDTAKSVRLGKVHHAITHRDRKHAQPKHNVKLFLRPRDPQ